jgi:hypothetical protein
MYVHFRPAGATSPRLGAVHIAIRGIQVFLVVAALTFGIAAVVSGARADEPTNSCIRLDDADDPLGCATDLNEPGREAAAILFTITSVAMGIGAPAINGAARRARAARER